VQLDIVNELLLCITLHHEQVPFVYSLKWRTSYCVQLNIA